LARADERLITNKTIQSLAEKYNKSIAQICLRWALQHDFIVLPKSKSNARIAENFKVFDFKLSEEDMKSIDQLTSFNVRTCWDPHSITH
jgi:diketogulonate reductase-like aldo/keto reductase